MAEQVASIVENVTTKLGHPFSLAASGVRLHATVAVRTGVLHTILYVFLVRDAPMLSFIRTTQSNGYSMLHFVRLRLWLAKN